MWCAATAQTPSAPQPRPALLLEPRRPSSCYIYRLVAISKASSWSLQEAPAAELTLLVLNLGLHILDGVRRLHLEGDGLTREGLHEDLHGCPLPCLRCEGPPAVSKGRDLLEYSQTMKKQGRTFLKEKERRLETPRRFYSSAMGPSDGMGGRLSAASSLEEGNLSSRKASHVSCQ